MTDARSRSVEARAAEEVASLRLWYRHLNQAETYRSLEMQRDGGRFRAQLPRDYTDSPYPLQYYFEARSAAGVAVCPGFGHDSLGRPYFVTEPS